MCLIFFVMGISLVENVDNFLSLVVFLFSICFMELICCCIFFFLLFSCVLLLVSFFLVLRYWYLRVCFCFKVFWSFLEVLLFCFLVVFKFVLSFIIWLSVWVLLCLRLLYFFWSFLFLVLMEVICLMIGWDVNVVNKFLMLFKEGGVVEVVVLEEERVVSFLVDMLVRVS